MQFLPSEEQGMAIDGLRRFMDDIIEPEFIAHGDGFIPKEKMLDWLTRLSEFGLVNAPHAAKHGGLDMGWITHGLLWEEVAFSSLDIALPILINASVADMLIHIASDPIRERYLPDLMTGRSIACMGISEPDVGSDVSAVKTRAVRDGEDYIINGEKTWISNGQHSDFIICTCATPKGLTHILIDREEHGYEVAGIPKIALNGQSTAQVFLTDVRVPATNVIGGVGQALRQTLILFERARCHMGLWGISVGRRALHEAIRYSQERTQHGKAIAGHQLIAAKISTMATELDAARLLVHRAMSLIDAGQRCDTECAMAKWYGTEVGLRAARGALQIHGGNGVTKEFIVERLLREAVIGPIPDGTTEIHKLLIARNLTGIQAFK